MTKRDLAFVAGGVAAAALGFGAYRLATVAQTSTAATAAPVPAAAVLDQPAPSAMPAVPAAAQAAAPGRAVPSVADLTDKMAARLAKSGGTPADWQLLGKSYEFLGRKAEAAAAFARAGGRPSEAAAETVTRVTGTVEVAPPLRAKLPANAILFVLAKSALLAGPPLAVVRIPVTSWPVSFKLDDSNAMMPSANLSSAEKVVIEARVSLSGNPLAQPGDLTGSQAAIDPRKAQPLRIVIDRLIR